MDLKLRVLVFIGSMANYCRLSSVCKAIKESRDLELQLVIGASMHDEMHAIPFEVDERITCLAHGNNHESMSLTTGILLTKFSGTLERLKPNIVLVHGDRYEVLAVAIACRYQNIPLAHTEGGDLSGTVDDYVRNAITCMASIHFPITIKSANRIVRKLQKEVTSHVNNVYVVGSSALDSIREIRYESIDQEKQILVLLHPDTTKPLYSKIGEFIQGVEMAAETLEAKICYLAPNCDSGREEIENKFNRNNWTKLKRLSHSNFAREMKMSLCVVGNSSSFIKEASFLGVPAVIVGDRQHDREVDANVVFAKMDANVIRKNIISQAKAIYQPSDYFGNGSTASDIVHYLRKINLVKV